VNIQCGQQEVLGVSQVEEEDDPRTGGQWRKTPGRAAGGFDPPQLLGTIEYSAKNMTRTAELLLLCGR
jgi:hypothetical protein